MENGCSSYKLHGERAVHRARKTRRTGAKGWFRPCPRPASASTSRRRRPSAIKSRAVVAASLFRSAPHLLLPFPPHGGHGHGRPPPSTSISRLDCRPSQVRYVCINSCRSSIPSIAAMVDCGFWPHLYAASYICSSSSLVGVYELIYLSIGFRGASIALRREL